MDGPLFDDWYIGISLAPPHYPGAGPTIVIRWNEPGPFPDQRRVYSVLPSLLSMEIGDLIQQLVTGYYESRASTVRRLIAAYERTGWLRL